VVRCAARLLRQPGDGRPEDAGVADGVPVELVGVDHEVWCLGKPVEIKGKVVRWEDLAERDGRRQVGDGADVAVVHAEATHLATQEAAEWVVSGPGDHGSTPPVPGRGDGDVRGTAA